MSTERPNTAKTPEFADLSSDTPQVDPPQAHTPQADTKEQLLDAAERLIGEQGIDGASVRAITEIAGANLAAVNYHFGSKEGLVGAVFERRLVPINRERLLLLDKAQAQPEGASVEDIVRSFVMPPLRMLSRQQAPHFGSCMIRALTDPGEQFRHLLLQAFEDVLSRFGQALGQALPDGDPADVFWRLHFMIGSMAYTVGMGHMVEEYSHGICSCEDFGAIGEKLVRFVTAGMEAQIGETTP